MAATALLLLDTDEFIGHLEERRAGCSEEEAGAITKDAGRGQKRCTRDSRNFLKMSEATESHRMPLNFEWDERKAELNRKKHGIRFEEASTVFADSLSLTIPDPLHSEAEERFAIIGRSEEQRLLVVVHRERGDRIRLISARQATTRERKAYGEDNG